MDVIGEIPLFNTKALKQTFLNDHSSSLDRRRRIQLLSGLGLIGSVLVELRQIGVIRHLPDLPWKIFDANAVTTSEKAYDLGIPDAALANLNLALISILASWGANQKLYRQKWMSKMLLGIVALNGAAATMYLLNMILRQKKICMYCLGAAGISYLFVPLAWAEVREREQ
jgi:uncharacterized membrane protein